MNNIFLIGDSTCQTNDESTFPQVGWGQFFEEYLNEHKILYMTKLPKINDIIEGKVPIMSPIKLFEDYPCYTIETYVMHLKNIIYFLENYENFYFVPYDKVWGDYNLTVNEDGLAFLYKNIRLFFF